jgi:hypothetical protein
MFKSLLISLLVLILEWYQNLTEIKLLFKKLI